MQAVTASYWEETVYRTAPLRGLVRSDMSVIFDWLGRNFPADGGKIDWRRAPGEHVHWKIEDGKQLAARASSEICRRLGPNMIAEHVGDSLSPYGVRFPLGLARDVVAALLEVPEHHYFLAEDRSWVVAVTSEGDLDAVDWLGSR